MSSHSKFHGGVFIHFNIPATVNPFIFISSTTMYLAVALEYKLSLYPQEKTKYKWDHYNLNNWQSSRVSWISLYSLITPDIKMHTNQIFFLWYAFCKTWNNLHSISSQLSQVRHIHIQMPATGISVMGRTKFDTPIKIEILIHMFWVLYINKDY